MLAMLPKAMLYTGAARSSDTRERILTAAAGMVADAGVDALTTRAVAAAAGCQAPTLYRLFGDKQGLLDALAERVLAAYAAQTLHKPPLDDVLEDLRCAWDEHIAFGLAHPAVYRLMTAASRSGRPSPAAKIGMEALRNRVQRVARAGLLRVSEERAVSLIHAAGTGTVTVLLETHPDRRDATLSRTAREAIMVAILAVSPLEASSDGAQLACALRTRLGETAILTPGERLMMDELLARLSNGV